MTRSVKKATFVDACILRHLRHKSGEQTSQEEPTLQTRSRRSEIQPEMVGTKFKVHTGKRFITVHVTEEMVGHKLGEFASTKGAGGRKR